MFLQASRLSTVGQVEWPNGPASRHASRHANHQHATTMSIRRTFVFRSFVSGLNPKNHFRSTLTIALLAVAVLAGCDSSEDSDGPFFVAFQKQVAITETGSQLACGGPEYSVGHPTYTASFAEVDGATGYTGRVLKKDDTYATEFTLANVDDDGAGNLTFNLGVGPIVVFLTCSQSSAQAEQTDRLDYLDTVGHQGIEVTPVF